MTVACLPSAVLPDPSCCAAPAGTLAATLEGGEDRDGGGFAGGDERVVVAPFEAGKALVERAAAWEDTSASTEEEEVEVVASSDASSSSSSSSSSSCEPSDVEAWANKKSRAAASFTVSTKMAELVELWASSRWWYLTHGTPPSSEK